MRNVGTWSCGAFISSVGVAGAQERHQSTSSGSGFGVGNSVGDVSATGRTAAFDRTASWSVLAARDHLWACLGPSISRVLSPETGWQLS